MNRHRKNTKECFLLCIAALYVLMGQVGGKGERKNDLNVSKTSPTPVAFWPIRTSLHDSVYNSERRYAKINGSSISVPGAYNVDDYGYVPINGSSSLDIENRNGELNGADAMTWILYIRMTSVQSATLLQYSYTDQSDFTFGLVDQNNLYISCTDSNKISYTFKSQFTIPANGQWTLVGFTFNKLWTNNDQIDIMEFQNPYDNPETETFGMGNSEVRLEAVGNIRIGKAWDDTKPFIGDISCIQFYSTSLLGGTRKETYELCDPNLNTLPGDHTLDENGAQSNSQATGTSSSSPQISCGSLSIPNNARIVVQGYYYSNLSAVVCDVGYAVSSGDAIRQCNAAGQWDGKEPICSLASWKYDENGNNGNFNHLLLDKGSLSKQRRMRISVYESKPSKVFLGTCGIIVITVISSYVVLMDGLSFLKECRRRKRSKKQSSDVRNSPDMQTISNYSEVGASKENLFNNRLRHKPRIRLISRYRNS